MSKPPSRERDTRLAVYNPDYCFTYQEYQVHKGKTKVLIFCCQILGAHVQSLPDYLRRKLIHTILEKRGFLS